MYALNLADDARILSAAVVLPNGKYDGMPIVCMLPDGDIYEYMYIKGEYIHNPLPLPEIPTPEPTTEERLAALEAALLERDVLIAEMALKLGNQE